MSMSHGRIWYLVDTTIEGQAENEATIISSWEVDIFVNTEQCFHGTATIIVCIYVFKKL